MTRSNIKKLSAEGLKYCRLIDRIVEELKRGNVSEERKAILQKKVTKYQKHINDLKAIIKHATDNNS